LDGPWNIFVIQDDSGDPVITPDGKFHLKHDSANKLESSSVHGKNKLTGSSEPDGSGGFDISISEELPSGKHRPYVGKVLENKPPTDPKRKVIGGLTFEPEEITGERSKVSEELEPGQLDGIWVGTQP
jgi:hypothetical protein